MMLGNWVTTVHPHSRPGPGGFGRITLASQSLLDRDMSVEQTPGLSFSVGVVWVWNLRKSKGGKGTALFRIGHGSVFVDASDYSETYCPCLAEIHKLKPFIPVFRHRRIYLLPLNCDGNDVGQGAFYTFRGLFLVQVIILISLMMIRFIKIQDFTVTKKPKIRDRPQLKCYLIICYY